MSDMNDIIQGTLDDLYERAVKRAETAETRNELLEGQLRDVGEIPHLEWCESHGVEEHPEDYPEEEIEDAVCDCNVGDIRVKIWEILSRTKPEKSARVVALEEALGKLVCMWPGAVDPHEVVDARQLLKSEVEG